jgi:hypothetical protein
MRDEPIRGRKEADWTQSGVVKNQCIYATCSIGVSCFPRTFLLLKDSCHRIVERWIVGADVVGRETGLDQHQIGVVAIFHSSVKRIHDSPIRGFAEPSLPGGAAN